MGREGFLTFLLAVKIDEAAWIVRVLSAFARGGGALTDLIRVQD
ncbi:hypothetical protein OAH34_00620 [bacterium]|nr:hypothetical protein [bacterium]